MANRILILSGKEPSHSGNLGQNLIDSLTGIGYEVTYNSEEISEYLQKVYRRKNSFFGRVLTKIIIEINRLFGSTILGLKGYYSKNGYVFFHADEAKPPYDSKKIIDLIKGNFDAIITLFPNNLFNIKSLGEIYRKTGIPIFIWPPDMYPMTGGCIYFDQCEEYKRDCKFCPAFNGIRHSLASHNYLIKKDVYQHSNITIFLNTWMSRYFIKSNLFREDQLQLVSIPIDENLYRPLDRRACRTEIGISENKIVFLIRNTSQKKERE